MDDTNKQKLYKGKAKQKEKFWHECGMWLETWTLELGIISQLRGYLEENKIPMK